jgi:hypothetical protein
MENFLFLEQAIENEEMEQIKKLIAQSLKSSKSLEHSDGQVHSP